MRWWESAFQFPGKWYRSLEGKSQCQKNRVEESEDISAFAGRRREMAEIFTNSRVREGLDHRHKRGAKEEKKSEDARKFLHRRRPSE